jgi:hypothetical protein
VGVEAEAVFVMFGVNEINFDGVFVIGIKYILCGSLGLEKDTAVRKWLFW